MNAGSELSSLFRMNAAGFRVRLSCFSLFAIALAVPLCTAAFERIEGTFTARQACPASVRMRQAASSDVPLSVGTAYPVIGLNRPGGDHVQIRLPGLAPEPRWVSLDCGNLLAAGQPAAPVPESAPATAGRELLLALSWEPAFCESKPDLPECRSQTPERRDASQFSLHGLWPQPEGLSYCGVGAAERALDQRRAWGQLREPPMSDETRHELAGAMPGVASFLHRHEWARHGSCYEPADADRYFRTALALLKTVNGSALQSFMSAHIGQMVTLGQLQAAFTASFGNDAGQALEMQCLRDGGRILISEIRIRLKAAPGEPVALEQWLDKSPRVPDECRQGIIDAAGLTD